MSAIKEIGDWVSSLRGQEARIRLLHSQACYGIKESRISRFSARLQKGKIRIFKEKYVGWKNTQELAPKVFGGRLLRGNRYSIFHQPGIRDPNQ
jgi:hypothetical protein